MATPDKRGGPALLPAFHNGGMPGSERAVELYCPVCERPVTDPLMCGDCHAVICRVCGTPLERIDDLGIG
jgi:hypothetical protein